MQGGLQPLAVERDLLPPVGGDAVARPEQVCRGISVLGKLLGLLNGFGDLLRGGAGFLAGDLLGLLRSRGSGDGCGNGRLRCILHRHAESLKQIAHVGDLHVVGSNDGRLLLRGRGGNGGPSALSAVPVFLIAPGHVRDGLRRRRGRRRGLVELVLVDVDIDPASLFLLFGGGPALALFLILSVLDGDVYGEGLGPRGLAGSGKRHGRRSGFRLGLGLIGRKLMVFDVLERLLYRDLGAHEHHGDHADDQHDHRARLAQGAVEQLGEKPADHAAGLGVFPALVQRHDMIEAQVEPAVVGKKMDDGAEEHRHQHHADHPRQDGPPPVENQDPGRPEEADRRDVEPPAVQALPHVQAQYVNDKSSLGKREQAEQGDESQHEADPTRHFPADRLGRGGFGGRRLFGGCRFCCFCG